MGLFTHRAPQAELPPAIAAALELAKGERVLAFAVDDNTGAHIVATTYALVVVTSAGRASAVGVSAAGTSDAGTSDAGTSDAGTSDAGTSSVERTLRRRWLSVDAGAWEPETATLTVTWADGKRAGQWSFRDQQTLFPETVRERVQASVVLSTRLNLGDRRSGRVAIRQDFATRELIAQTILGRYARADDPEVQAHVQAALAHLKDQVGLPA
jgi:hypothetical protein